MFEKYGTRKVHRLWSLRQGVLNWVFTDYKELIKKMFISYFSSMIKLRKRLLMINSFNLHFLPYLTNLINEFEIINFQSNPLIIKIIKKIFGSTQKQMKWLLQPHWNSDRRKLNSEKFTFLLQKPEFFHIFPQDDESCCKLCCQICHIW